MQEFFLLLLSFVFGISFGSFFNVLIYRIPRRESIIWPPSHCPKCKTKIKSYHNIPILSYLLLRGKCAYCKEKISIRYLLLELLFGLIFVGFYLVFLDKILVYL